MYSAQQFNGRIELSIVAVHYGSSPASHSKSAILKLNAKLACPFTV